MELSSCGRFSVLRGVEEGSNEATKVHSCSSCSEVNDRLWLKQFYKTMDLVIHFKAENSFWGKDQFEPLIIGICSPYASHFPWVTRNTPKMYQVGRDVRRMLPEKKLAAGNLLRQLLVEGRKLSTMPTDVVQRVLYFIPRNTVPSDELDSQKAKRRSDKKRPSDQRLEENSSAKRRISQGSKR